MAVLLPSTRLAGRRRSTDAAHGRPTTTTSPPFLMNARESTTTSPPHPPNVRDSTTTSQPFPLNVTNSTTNSPPHPPNVGNSTAGSPPHPPNVRNSTTTSPNARQSTRTSPPLPLALSAHTLPPHMAPSPSLSPRHEIPRSPLSPRSAWSPRPYPDTASASGEQDISILPSSSPPVTGASTSAKLPASCLAKLHKRGGSGSLPGPPSPYISGNLFATPYATYEEPSSAVAPALSTPKIKPYLRKMSAARENHGTIDLDQSVTENERLAGLGIADWGPPLGGETVLGHSSRRQPHARTTSIGSQVSNGSATLRPGQAFVHPATKTPRPYTPPGASYASSLHDDYAQESEDVVEDEFRLGAGFRTKRSMSNTSTNPTPLPLLHTASDLGLVPKLTSASQSNLSIMSRASSPSGTKGRPRKGTDQSDLALSPQTTGRPSIEKAFSFVSGRRSDPDAPTRDEVIRNARRKFEEKEAKKDSKLQRRRESEEAKREASKQRKRSNASELAALTAARQHAGIAEKSASLRKGSSAKERGGIPPDEANFQKRKGSSAKERAVSRHDELDGLYGRSYEDYRPAHVATLPRYGDQPGESEKTGPMQHRGSSEKTQSGSWMRFSTWLQTRILSCGGRRRRR